MRDLKFFWLLGVHSLVDLNGPRMAEIFLSFLAFVSLFFQFYRITETVVIVINLAFLYPSQGYYILLVLLICLLLFVLLGLNYECWS